MRKLFIIIILFFCFASCKTKKQDKVDNRTVSLRLFKEGGDLYLKGFSIEFEDSLGAQKLYREAILKFNAAYDADTNNTDPALYLDELYARTGQFDSALVWSLRLFPYKYQKFSKNSPTVLSHNYRFIGEYYFYEGDSANGKKYFHLALKEDKKQIISLGQTLFDIADKLYFGTLPNQDKKLKSMNIDPCKYSLDMMRFGLSLSKEEWYLNDFLFTKKKLMEREKNCL